MGNTQKVLVGKLEGKRPLGRLYVYGWAVLERILEKQGGKIWTGFIWLRTETGEHGNEPSGSTEDGEFLD